MSTATSRPDVLRLSAIRLAFRFTKKAFAAKLGVSPSLLTEVGSPRRNIGVSWRLAGLVQEKLGISANWILTATGRPLVSEPDEYPAGVAQSLEDFVGEEQRVSGFSHV